MTKRIRIIALLLALAVAFVMLFSAIYIVAEADHDCTGIHCSICAHIQVCKTNLKNLSTALTIIVLNLVLAAVLCLYMVQIRTFSSLTTLVSLKVKLSN